MPLLRVEMFEGRTNETKRKLVTELTEATARALNCPEDSVSVMITDVSKDDWGIGGEMARDKFPD